MWNPSNNRCSILVLGAIALTTGGIAWSAAWRAINTGLPGASFGVTALTVDPDNSTTLYAVTNGGSLFKSTDAAVSWQPVGGLVGVSSLAVDPRNSAVLYGATRHGIFKSTDGGGTWRGINAGLPDAVLYVSVVAVSLETNSTLYSLVNNRVFKTTDGGETWIAETLPGPAGPLGSLTVDPVTRGTLYAVTYNGAIYKSVDGAASWTTLKPAAPNIGFGSVLQLAVDPQMPATIYAGSFAAGIGPVPPGPADNGAGTISKSTDGGETWTAIRAGIPGDAFIRSLSIDPSSPSTIYACYSGDGRAGVLKSLDSGQSWSVADSVSQSSGYSLVVVGKGSPSKVYAAYADFGAAGSIRSSTDGGSTWSAANAGLEYLDLRTLKFDPRHAGVVYTGGAGGVFRSLDSGANWTSLGAFLISPQPSPPQAPSNPFGVGPAVVRSLLIGYTTPSVLYVDVARVNGCAFNDKLVFKSADDGASWDDSVSPPDSGCLVGGLLGRGGGLMAIDPTDPEVIYLEESDDGDGLLSLLKSSDGGATWSTLWDWSTQKSGVNALLIDPTNSATLYAGLGDQNVIDSAPGGTGLYKSTDGGTTWNNSGLEKGAVTVLAMDPANPGILYAGTEGIYTAPPGFRGLFKSDDGGGSWLAINTGLTGLSDVGAAITALVVAPNRSNILYAGTSGDGVYKSGDGGASWARFSDGLKSLDVRALAFAPDSTNTLFAATASGIFTVVDKIPAN